MEGSGGGPLDGGVEVAVGGVVSGEVGGGVLAGDGGAVVVLSLGSVLSTTVELGLEVAMVGGGGGAPLQL